MEEITGKFMIESIQPGEKPRNLETLFSIGSESFGAESPEF